MYLLIKSTKKCLVSCTFYITWFLSTFCLPPPFSPNCDLFKTFLYSCLRWWLKSALSSFLWECGWTNIRNCSFCLTYFSVFLCYVLKDFFSLLAPLFPFSFNCKAIYSNHFLFPKHSHKICSKGFTRHCCGCSDSRLIQEKNKAGFTQVLIRPASHRSKAPIKCLLTHSDICRPVAADLTSVSQRKHQSWDNSYRNPWNGIKAKHIHN